MPDDVLPDVQLVLYEGEDGCVVEDVLSVLWRDRGAQHMHMLVSVFVCAATALSSHWLVLAGVHLLCGHSAVC
jgi:hypothetical protein